MNRRRFLATTAALAAAPLVPPVPRYADSVRGMRCDNILLECLNAQEEAMYVASYNENTRQLLTHDGWVDAQ